MINYFIFYGLELLIFDSFLPSFLQTFFFTCWDDIIKFSSVNSLWPHQNFHIKIATAHDEGQRHRQTGKNTGNNRIGQRTHSQE